MLTIVGTPLIARALDSSAPVASAQASELQTIELQTIEVQAIGTDSENEIARSAPNLARAERRLVPPTPAAPVPVDTPTDIPAPPVVLPGPSASQWEALRQCESNGNYAITNPSGKYRGAYQFDRPTWNSVAERYAPHLVGVDPAAASPADQDGMAYALWTERGAQPWPHCGRHLL
jgi:hypothetical protein